MSIDPPFSSREIQSRKGETCTRSKSNISMGAGSRVPATPFSTNIQKTTHAGAVPISSPWTRQAAPWGADRPTVHGIFIKR